MDTVTPVKRTIGLGRNCALYSPDIENALICENATGGYPGGNVATSNRADDIVGELEADLWTALMETVQ